MAPNISVPANFGIKHLNSPAHGNLILKLKDGEEMRTNSMIMSLNSPVIENLTTDLAQVRNFHCFSAKLSLISKIVKALVLVPYLSDRCERCERNC